MAYSISLLRFSKSLLRLNSGQFFPPPFWHKRHPIKPLCTHAQSHASHPHPLQRTSGFLSGSALFVSGAITLKCSTNCKSHETNCRYSTSQAKYYIIAQCESGRQTECSSIYFLAVFVFFTVFNRAVWWVKRGVTWLV